MIATDNLTLSVGSRILVEQLNWQVAAGQCWTIIGRNGAGKSTLLHTLAGLRQPDAGAIRFNGKALADWAPEQLARQRAFLAQGRGDAFAYRVIDTVLAARHPYHANRYWEDSDDHRIAHAALATMEVAELAGRDVRSLSGGERQRVAIAALLAQDTPLLLLDEPANALDLAHQVRVMGLLARLCRHEQKTAIMVGHDLNLAHSVASHALLLMGEGRWLAGPVGDIMQAPLLSQCLVQPIDIIPHGDRRNFIPKEETT